MTFGTTQCDVPLCSATYTIKYNESIPPNHISERWINLNGNAICPTHAVGVKLEGIKLGLRMKE
jgi:hypothetical protein